MELCLVQDMINGLEQPETFLAQLKMVTKNTYSNVPHLLESIKDMLPHIQQALVSNETSIEGISAPLLFDSLLMTEAHALSMLLGRILDRIMQQKKTLQGRKQDLLLVQHTIYGWFELQQFICKINENLKLNIPETENIFNNLKIALEFIGHGCDLERSKSPELWLLQMKKQTIKGTLSLFKNLNILSKDLKSLRFKLGVEFFFFLPSFCSTVLTTGCS